jgi:hypothetical protein
MIMIIISVCHRRSTPGIGDQKGPYASKHSVR